MSPCDVLVVLKKVRELLVILGEVLEDQVLGTRSLGRNKGKGAKSCFPSTIEHGGEVLGALFETNTLTRSNELALDANQCRKTQISTVQHGIVDGPRSLGLDTAALQEMSDYWAAVRSFYKPFDTSEPYGTAEVYLHEMPGGQYTNLKEQAESMGIGHRWPEIARMYAEVNLLFGDIVKVTPSSKVVGDMCMFMITRGVKPGDARSYLDSLPAGTSFPESVIDMLQGGLGQPMGGWPADVQKIILGKKKPFTNRPGERAEKVDLDKTRHDVAKVVGHKEPTDDDLYSHLMYPQVFADFVKFRKAHSDISVLPTPAYFYGLRDKEEITISLEAGKTLFARLLNLNEPDPTGQRTAIFELNGYPRHVQVTDKSVTKTTVTKVKADPADVLQIGAPMPGMVASFARNASAWPRRASRSSPKILMAI